MVWKDVEARRAYDREWSKKNRESRKRLNDAWRAKQYLWYKNLKATLRCNRCSENHPAVIQFHHLDGKDANISEMVLSWSKERLLEEIAKCEVLCANCHFKEHWNDES